MGDPTVPAAQIATPDIALGGSTFPQGGPCAFISQGLLATCQYCNGFPDYINPTPEAATCPGGCFGYPGSVTYALQIASIPNNAPQFSGATFNIETTQAHLKIPSEIQSCSQYGNPYSVSGGGGTYTVTQTADPPVVSGKPLQSCVVDIYDQWGDGVVITMSPNIPPNQ